MVEIQIIGPGSTNLGINTHVERGIPLQVEIEKVTAENLEQYIDNLDIPNSVNRERILRNIAEGASVYLVAIDPTTKKVAGFINVNIKEDNMIYIETSKEYQGRTVGRQLMRALQEEYTMLSLDNLAGEAAHTFYKNMGFIDEGLPGHMVWRKA